MTSCKKWQSDAEKCQRMVKKEEIYWFGRLPKPDYLVENSRSSFYSDDSNPAPLIETAGVDIYIVQVGKAPDSRKR